jgi:hypothetical protein
MMIMKARIDIEKQNKLMEDDYRIEPSVIIGKERIRVLLFLSLFSVCVCFSRKRKNKETNKQTELLFSFFVFFK